MEAESIEGDTGMQSFCGKCCEEIKQDNGFKRRGSPLPAHLVLHESFRK